MNEEPKAYFEKTGDLFIGTPAARGPWSEDHCHAGPVTALIARIVEKIVGPEKQLTRLTVDLVAPLPLNGLRFEGKCDRDGRTLSTANALVTDLDGRLCATATSIHLANRSIGPVPTAPVSNYIQSEATELGFPVREVAHGARSFADFIKVAYPQGETREPGPTTLWMKTLPLLPDEAPSSFQRLCPLADCGNGISRNDELNNIRFMNIDITIVRHRISDSEWLASSSRSEWQSSGIGLTTAVLQDEEGPVATVLQTLMLSRAKG